MKVEGNVGIPTTPEFQTRRETRVPRITDQIFELVIALNLPVKNLEKRSTVYNPPYIAFESVRKGPRNPFVMPWLATGIEGYWAGNTDNPVEVMTDLLDIGHAALQETEKHGTNMANRIQSTLQGHIMDPEAIQLAEQLFLAVRDTAIDWTHDSEKEREEFRKKTHEAIIPSVHNVVYIEGPSYTNPQVQRPVRQQITLPELGAMGITKKLDRPLRLDNRGKVVKLDYNDMYVLNWLRELGIVGHPFMRLCLQKDDGENNLYTILSQLKNSQNLRRSELKGRPKKLIHPDSVWSYF